MSTRKTDYNDDRFDRLFIGVWLAVLAGCVVFWAGVAYVAIHFISKWW